MSKKTPALLLIRVGKSDYQLGDPGCVQSCLLEINCFGVTKVHGNARVKSSPTPWYPSVRQEETEGRKTTSVSSCLLLLLLAGTNQNVKNYRLTQIWKLCVNFG